MKTTVASMMTFSVPVEWVRDYDQKRREVNGATGAKLDRLLDELGDLEVKIATQAMRQFRDRIEGSGAD